MFYLISLYCGWVHHFSGQANPESSAETVKVLVKLGEMEWTEPAKAKLTWELRAATNWFSCSLWMLVRLAF